MKNTTKLTAAGKPKLDRQQGLLIVAHGSRLASSNREVARFTRSVKHTFNAKKRLQENLAFENTGDLKRSVDALDVLVCFLELAHPSIPKGLEILVERGAEEIFVFPYFLAYGTHVSKDIPQIVTDEVKRLNTVSIKKHRNPISVRILPHLGKMDNLATATYKHVLDSI